VLELEEDQQARLAVIRHAIEEGRLDEAERQLAQLLTQEPAQGESWFLFGILRMQREEHAGAHAAFLKALERGADRRKARLGICMATLGEGKAEPAWEAATALLQDHPDDQEGLHWLLRAGTALERWSELAQALREFLGRNPGDSSARFALASVLVRIGHQQEAWEEYQRLRLLDQHFDGLAELALACRNQDPVAVN
jgi:Flp pilus assembly protein TadD